MGIPRTHLLVLNYNGRSLLGECLPSIVEAADRYPGSCRVSVVDNGSTDGSVEELTDHWRDVGIFQEPNRGLASFNHVLARLDEPVVVLLNNDVILSPDAVKPLVEAVQDHPDALFSAPRCWSLDGQEYEGMRSRVRFRFGLVQGMCRVPGHQRFLNRPDLTASAGPVLAVDRRKFLSVGGYDPVYFPGRIEDLDLGFAAWMAGWKGIYVPESVAHHHGGASFQPEFGAEGCDRLAARNALLFAWKNLAGRRLRSHLTWLPARLRSSLAFGKGQFARAFVEALGQLQTVHASRQALAVGKNDWEQRQEAFFRRFQW